MVTVRLYSRPNCHLCEDVKQELETLQATLPHKLEEVNIEQDTRLMRQYAESIPVVEIGPYKLKAPIDMLDLQISLGAAQRSLEDEQSIDAVIAQSRQSYASSWTGSDRFSYWLSRHYLFLLNLFVLLYMGLPFLAPVLMNAGASGPAGVIYKVYGFACHQMAFRSMFLFGEQPFYPRTTAGVDGLIPYGQATGLSEEDLWTARQFVGNEAVGFKVALCERDIAIYVAILGFGLLFGLLRMLPIPGRKPGYVLPSIPWYVWVLFGLVPVGLDGVSQLLSQAPFYLLEYRESTPFLRTLTGGLFGFVTAWFGYPMVEESMFETRQYLAAKFERLQGHPGNGRAS